MVLLPPPPLPSAPGSRGGGQVQSRGRQGANTFHCNGAFQLELKSSHQSLARAAVFGLHRHGVAPHDDP